MPHRAQVRPWTPNKAHLYQMSPASCNASAFLQCIPENSSRLRSFYSFLNRGVCLNRDHLGQTRAGLDIYYAGIALVVLSGLGRH